MALFTAILEVEGGTYVAQVHATNERDALAEYSKRLINYSIGTKAMRRALSKRLNEDTLVELSGVKNVWCCSANLSQKLALLNIIETAE